MERRPAPSAFAQAARTAPAPVYRPSPAQADLMARLIGEIRELDATVAESAVAYVGRMDGHWTPGRDGNVSRFIDRLIAKAKELRATAARQAREAAKAAEIEDGMYLLNGEIYKVVHAVHGSGRQYAKHLVTPEVKGESASWEMARGVVGKLRAEHRMTLEQAKEYGAIYGVCCNCGAVLTDEESIAAGIGPVCAKRF